MEQLTKEQWIERIRGDARFNANPNRLQVALEVIDFLGYFDADTFNRKLTSVARPNIGRPR